MNNLQAIASETTNSNPELSSDAVSLVTKITSPFVTRNQIRMLLNLIAEGKVEHELEEENKTRVLLKFELLSVVDEAIRQTIGLKLEHSEINLNVNRTTVAYLLKGWASSMYLDSQQQPVNADDDSGALKFALEFSADGKTWLERDCDSEWHMSPDRDSDGKFAELHAELLAAVPFKRAWPKKEKIRVFERVLDLQQLMVERCKAAEREPQLYFTPLVLSEDAAEQLTRMQHLATQTFGSYDKFLDITKEVKKTRNYDAHANAFRTLTYDQLRDKLSDDTVALGLLELAKNVANDSNLPLAEMRHRDQPGVSTEDSNGKRAQRVSQLVSDWSKQIGI